MATDRRFPSILRRRLLKVGTAFCLAMATLPAGAADYQSLTIVAPADQATIHDNQGHLRIEAAATPPLSVGSGDRFVFVVDGVPMLPSRNDTLTLDQMDRGSHTLQVQIVDGSGNTLIASPTSTVHLWHASALMPKAGIRP
jgi:anti-sigma factor RsiW